MAEQALVTAEPVATTPAQLLATAVEKGADLDQLTKLMDLQDRWERNEARKAFVAAMSAFRAEAPSLARQSEGHNYNYSSLDYITQKVNPILSKHGLSFGWVTEQGELITVHCDVTHVQGHSARVSLTGGPDKTGSKNDIQAIGSTVSYLQRYTLLSALGLATGGQDNDAVPQVQTISEKEAATLRDMIEATGADMDKILEYAKAGTIEEIQPPAYKKVMKILKERE